MICVTDKPLLKNFHSNKDFLNLLKLEEVDCQYLNIKEKNISIPLIKKVIKENIWHGFTPIHFQRQLGTDFWKKNINQISEVLLSKGCVSFYIQTKDFIESLADSDDSLYSTKRLRTNYYFDLNRSEHESISSHKRDSRSRLRKALKSDYNLKIKGTNYEAFSKNYSAIAEKLKFTEKYSLELDAIKKINQNINLIEINAKDGTFLASGIFTECEDEVDYLYGADSFVMKDAIRLLVHEAANYYRTKDYKKVFLGGGVTENDNLAEFKERMGTTPVKCSTIMGITSKNKIQQILNTSLDRSIFEGYFPKFIYF